MKKIFAVCLLVGCNSDIKVQEKPQHHNNVVIDPVVMAPSGPSREELLQPLFNAMIQEEQDHLMFDEPRHENGRQLDGKLRPYWSKAYYNKQGKYTFENSTYYTMNKDHRPMVPQVCADFIVDTIDIAAGTWYQPALTHPKRNLGKLDFRKQIETEKLDPRNVGQLIKFFKAHPDNFQFIYDDTDSPQVGNPEALKIWFKDHAIQIGDLVFIRGKAPWDHEHEVHWHSFFITRLDESGLVSMIMGNATFPEEASLEKEVHRAPKRKVVSIIRMTNNFLQSFQ